MDGGYLAITFFAAIIVVSSVTDGQAAGSTGWTCSFNPTQRVDCGWSGIKRQVCESRGCCYDESVPGVNWCFYPNINTTASTKVVRGICTFTPDDRVDCGWSGIQSQVCKDRGCCYDESVRGVNWCFYPKTYDQVAENIGWTCLFDPKRRVDCGWSGIQRQVCEQRGCCYDESVPGVNWCFNPNINEQASAAVVSQSCSFSPSLRVDCGWPNIPKHVCENRGCCYDGSVQGANWCFYPMTDDLTEPEPNIGWTCSLRPSNRVDCGWPTIQRETCEERGCCYDESIPTANWCFYPNVNGRAVTEAVARVCSVSPDTRIDCGWSGISRECCQNRGCCYDETYRRANWCFYPNK